MTEIFAKTKSCMKPNNATERYRVSFEKCAAHLASTQNSCVTKRAHIQLTQIYTIPVNRYSPTTQLLDFVYVPMSKPLFHTCTHVTATISYMYSCHSHYFVYLLISQPLLHSCTHVTAIISYMYSYHSHYFIHVLMSQPFFTFNSELFLTMNALR